ncbi:hypothetical protein J6590_078813 [Homalodisca vitripennis]|nr:hypothetical protein J6590_078813 [Homalodisca vitripennis]
MLTFCSVTSSDSWPQSADWARIVWYKLAILSRDRGLLTGSMVTFCSVTSSDSWPQSADWARIVWYKLAILSRGRGLLTGSMVTCSVTSSDSWPQSADWARIVWYKLAILSRGRGLLTGSMVTFCSVTSSDSWPQSADWARIVMVVNGIRHLDNRIIDYSGSGNYEDLQIAIPLVDEALAAREQYAGHEDDALRTGGRLDSPRVHRCSSAD